VPFNGIFVFSQSSFTSYIEEEENSQTYLEEADAGLAVTEAALRKLPVGQLSLDQLKPLVTRHRRVSHCLERLRSTAEGDGQDDEDDEGKFDVPAQIFLGKPIRSASGMILFVCLDLKVYWVSFASAKNTFLVA
jgi:hypothetical protein